MLYVDTMQMLQFYLWLMSVLATLMLALVIILRVKYDGRIGLVWFAVIGCAVSYAFLIASYFVRIRGIG